MAYSESLAEHGLLSAVYIPVCMAVYPDETQWTAPDKSLVASPCHVVLALIMPRKFINWEEVV